MIHIIFTKNPRILSISKLEGLLDVSSPVSHSTNEEIVNCNISYITTTRTRSQGSRLRL